MYRYVIISNMGDKMLTLGGSIVQPRTGIASCPGTVHVVCAPLTKLLNPPSPQARDTAQSVAAVGSVPNSAAAMLSPWDPAQEAVTSNSILLSGLIQLSHSCQNHGAQLPPHKSVLKQKPSRQMSKCVLPRLPLNQSSCNFTYEIRQAMTGIKRLGPVSFTGTHATLHGSRKITTPSLELWVAVADLHCTSHRSCIPH